MRFITSVLPVTIALAAAALAMLPAARDSGAAPPYQVVTTVETGDFFYCGPDEQPGNCEVVVNQGDTVIWQHVSGDAAHTVTHCGDSCSSPSSSPVFSGNLGPGGSYSYTFTTPGTYLYYCKFHSSDMQASVIVEEGQSTPAPSAEPEPTPPPETEPPAPTNAPDPGSGATPATGDTTTTANGTNSAPVPTGRLTVASTPTVTPPPAASAQGEGSTLSTPRPSSASDDGGGISTGIPAWVWVVGGGALLAIAGGGSFVWRMRG